MTTCTVRGFFGPWRWLSTFWPADVAYQAVMYSTVEHAYQAAKTSSPLERQDDPRLSDARPGRADGKTPHSPRRLGHGEGPDHAGAAAPEVCPGAIAQPVGGHRSALSCGREPLGRPVLGRLRRPRREHARPPADASQE